jgi:hypothetical protein
MNEKAKMAALAEASSGSRDGDNTQSQEPGSPGGSPSPVMREKDPQALSFVEMVEFFLRTFSRQFGENTHKMHDKGYFA